jgi:hypothetical protein
LVSFFIPTIGWFNESLFSHAMSGGTDEKILFVYPVIGAMLLGVAHILHSRNARPWLRIIYIIPVGLMIIGAIDSGESISSFELRMSINQGGAAILLLLGGLAGSVVAAFVGVLSGRVSLAPDIERVQQISENEKLAGTAEPGKTKRTTSGSGGMLCPVCGGTNNQGAKFCVFCGVKLKDDALEAD